MLENKQIFITGGAGFIANTLIKNLIEKNKITNSENPGNPVPIPSLFVFL